MVATAIWKFCSASCRRSRACSSDPRTSKSSSKVKHPRCTSSGWSRQRCARWGLWTSATASAPQARRLPCHRRGRRSKSRLACWLRAAAPAFASVCSAATPSATMSIGRLGSPTYRPVVRDHPADRVHQLDGGGPKGFFPGDYRDIFPNPSIRREQPVLFFTYRIAAPTFAVTSPKAYATTLIRDPP